MESNQAAYDKFLTFLGLKDKDDKNRYIDFDEKKLNLINKTGSLRLWINKIKVNIEKGGYKYSCSLK